MKTVTSLEKYIEKKLWTAEEVQQKVQELAKWIDNEYKNSERIILVGLLKGCFPFFWDLVKKVSINVKTDYMRFSSYEGASISTSGDPRLILDTSYSLKDADVLVVDDIIDSGLTSVKVLNLIKSKQPKSVKMMALIDKKSGRVNDFKPDIYGFDSPAAFLVGYGLDVNDYFRQLPFIGVFKEEYLLDFED